MLLFDSVDRYHFFVKFNAILKIKNKLTDVILVVLPSLIPYQLLQICTTAAHRVTALLYIMITPW